MKRIRHRRLETLEKRQLLAADFVGENFVDTSQAVLMTAVEQPPTPPALTSSSFAAEGEQVLAEAKRLTGELSQNETFAMRYDEDTDVLTITSNDSSTAYVVVVPLGSVSQDGLSSITSAVFHTQPIVVDDGVGVVLPNVQIAQSENGGVTITIRELFSDDDDSAIDRFAGSIGRQPSEFFVTDNLTSNLRVLKFPTASAVFDAVASGTLATPADTLERSAAVLEEVGTPQFSIPAEVLVDVETEFAFTTSVSVDSDLVAVFNFGDGSPPIIDTVNPSGTLTHRFTRAGDFVAVVRLQRGETTVLESQFPVRVTEGADLRQPLLSQNRLFGLDSFDTVAIDSLNRGSGSTSVQPEIRFGVLSGQVAGGVLVDDAEFSDLRVRVTVSVDIEPAPGLRETRELSFVDFIDDEGVFAFHLEGELDFQLQGSQIQQARPRLSARSLKIEVLDVDQAVIDTLDVDQTELLRRLHPELNVLLPMPPDGASPRPLDVDVLVGDPTLVLSSSGRANLDLSLFLHNSQLAAAGLPVNSQARVEVDFGDGSPVQGANFNPELLSSSGRLDQPESFFGEQVDLRIALSQSQRDRLTRHRYTQAGEFDVTVTVTMPGGRASRETLSVTVEEFDNTPVLEVSGFSATSHLIDSETLIPRIGANLQNFFDPDDLVQDVNTFIGVEINGQSVSADVLRTRQLGNTTQFEVDVEGINLLDFVPDGMTPESIDPLPIRVEFFGNGDRDDSVVRFGTIDIEFPEIRNLGFDNTALAFDIDGGLRSSFSPAQSNDIIIQIDGLPVEFDFFGSNDPPQRVTPQLLVAQEDGVIINLDDKLIDAHFEGSVPQLLRNPRLIEDIEFSLKIFSRIASAEDTPLDSQRDKLLTEVSGLTLADLRAPALKLQAGSVRSSIPLLVLNDSDRQPDSFFPSEGRAIAELFNNFSSINFSGSVRAVARDNSVAFATNSNGEISGQLDISVSGNPNDAIIIPLTSGEVSFDLFTIGSDGDIDQLLRSFAFNVNRVTPAFEGIDSLSSLPALNFIDSSPVDRSIEITLVRGKNFFDGSDFSNQLSERRAAGEVILNTVQEIDVPINTSHRVRIDWGDGTFDEVDLLPLSNGGDFVTVEHVFELGHVENLFSAGTNTLGGERLIGDITLTVTQRDLNEQGEEITVGESTTISGTFQGSRVARIELDQDPILLAEIEDSFAASLENVDSFTQRKQMRKVAVGQPLGEVVIDIGQDFFDLEFAINPLVPSRITRGPNQNGFALLTLDESNPDDVLQIPFDSFSNEITLPATLPTGEPLFQFDSVGLQEITVRQVSGLSLETDFGNIVTEEVFGFIEIIAVPSVDLLSAGDGSLSGTINIGDIDVDDEVDIVLTAIDSPDVAPLRLVAGEEPSILEAIFAGEFFEPGRRIRVDVLGQEFTFDGGRIDTITSRIFTPNPLGEIEEAQVLFSGDLFQLTPIDVTIELSETTRQQAIDAAGIPLSLTISPGGGEDEFVIFRDADTPAGAFEIEGTDETVFFDGDNGIITLQTGLADDSRLIRYKNFGTHNFRVFNQTTFGATQITILDVLPTVIESPRGVFDGFGSFEFNVGVASQRGGRASVKIGDETIEQAFEAGDQEVTIQGNSPQLQEGPTQLLITEDEGDQSTTQEFPLNFVKESTRVSFDIGFDEDLQPLLNLDLSDVFAALQRRADQTGDDSDAFDFDIDIGDGSEIVNVRVHSILGKTATVTINGNAEEVATRSTGFVNFFGGTASVSIPFTPDQAGPVNIRILSNEHCIVGENEVNADAALAIVQELFAIKQPNGQTTITGVLPIGAQGPITFTSSSGASFTIDDVVGGQPFVIAQNGLQAGEELLARIGDDPLVSTIIDQKTNVIDIDIDVRANPDIEDQIEVAFDLNETLAAFAAEIGPDAEGILDLDVAFGQSTQPLTIAVFTATDGSFAAIQLTSLGPVTIFDATSDDIQQGIASVSLSVLAGQSVDIVIADDHLCFVGEASFARTAENETTVSGTSRIIGNRDEGNTVSGEFTIRQSGSEQTVIANVTSTGGSTTIGDTTIPSGEQADVTVQFTPDGLQIIGFDFEVDENSGEQGAVRLAIPDPNNDGENLDVQTDVFLIDIPGSEPCEDHLLFPSDVVFDGNVILVFADGNLTLTGDDENNGIALFVDDRGVVARPIGGTTLNGQSEAIVIVGGGTALPGDFTITSLGLGDDLLCVTDIRVMGNTDITSTPGDDVVLINNVDFDLLADIDVGTGNDIVDLTGTTADIAIRVNLGDGDDVFNGSEGRDIVSGGAGVDIINGAGGDDTITGDGGADIQRGGNGDDEFIWNNGDGPDDNFGDSGDDRFTFNGADGTGDVLRIALAADIGESGDGTHPSPDFDLTRTSPSAFTIEVSDVEAIQIDGLGGDDQIDASAIPADFFESVTLRGGGGDDMLSGTQGVDGLLGGDGNDVIIGNRGNDFGFGEGFIPFEVSANPGNDTFIWNNGDGADNFFGDDGDDTFQFNGADGSDDIIDVTPGADGGDFEAESEFGRSIDLTRVQPSAFTIETLGIESFEVNGLAGNDRLDASGLPADVVDVAFAGGLGDDDFLVSSLLQKTFDGGEGNNQLLGKGAAANLDFSDATDGAFLQVARIMLDPNASNRLTIDPDAIRRVMANDAELILRGDADDNIDIGQGWQSLEPETIDEQFHQVFRDEQLLAKVASGRPFQNILEPTDVNGDGRTSALDALLIINALRRVGSNEAPLDTNRSSAEESIFFQDVSGDGRINALDALRVINELSRVRNAAESEPGASSIEAPGSTVRMLQSTNESSRRRREAKAKFATSSDPSRLF